MAHEQTSLLPHEPPSRPENSKLDEATVTSTSLPWKPLIVLQMLTAVQPLAFELVFPFVNQMILEIGVVDDPTQVGFYSGLIESIFAIMSFITGAFCSQLIVFSCSPYSVARKPPLRCHWPKTSGPRRIIRISIFSYWLRNEQVIHIDDHQSMLGRHLGRRMGLHKSHGR